MPVTSPYRLIYILIIAAYLLIGALFAIRTPDWQAPDEPAHYNYVAQVAGDGCCPVIEMGDWQNEYQETLRANRFRPELLDELDTIQYEDHQPPLYYIPASLVFKLTNGSLTPLRLYSLVIGLAVVVLTYQIAREIYPDAEWIALSAMSFVAFLPQHLSIMASVNNDAAGEAIIALTLLQAIRYVKGRDIPVWRLGLLVGLGFVTKATTYLMVFIVGQVIFMRWWQSRSSQPFTTFLRNGVIAAIPALVLGGIWWLRNIAVYGFPDIFGLAAHDAVVIGQLRTADAINQWGTGEYINRLITTTFQSFWGQFGWMAVPLEYSMNVALLVVLVIALSGALIYALRNRTASAGWKVLIALWLLAWIAYAYYNSEFVQFQARYTYAGLIPFALILSVGVDRWRQLLTAQFKHSHWITCLFFLPLALLDLYLIWRVIVPNLSWEFMG